MISAVNRSKFMNHHVDDSIWHVSFPDANVRRCRRCSVFLEYQTLNLGALMVYPKVLLPLKFIMKVSL